jgi:tetratricopeptide (TPR) repeat protein
LSLWADIYKKSPDKARVNQHFGTALFEANRVDEAIPIFEKALRNYEKEIKLQTSVSPFKTHGYLASLGAAYERNGHHKKAILYLNRALEEFYFSAKTHQHLGVSYVMTGQLKKGVFHLSKALEYAKHHSSGISDKASVVKINRLLGVAKKNLEKKEERELLKKKNK